MTRHGQQAGSTLIELMVALALFAALSLMLMTGVKSARGAWNRLAERTSHGETVASSQTMLRALIERAYARNAITASTPYILFDGDAEQMRFLAAATDAEPAGPRRYALGLQGDSLVLSSAPDTKDAQADTTALVDGVAGLELAYFGVTEPDNQEHWRMRWQDQATLPELIRIRVLFAGNDRRRWPDLIVHPAVTLDSNCVIVASTGRCRGR